MRFLRGVLLAAAVVLLGFSLTPWVDSVSPAWWPVAQALVRPVLLAAVVGVVLALLLRFWLSALTFVVAALFAALVVVNAEIPRCKPAGSSLSLISLNLEFSGVPVGQVVEKVEDLAVDVLVLTEVDQSWLDEFWSTSVGKEFKFRAGHAPEEPDPMGTVVLSRVPGAELEVDTAAGTFSQPLLELEVEGRSVLVRGVHPKPPVAHMRQEWREGLEELGTWQRALRGRPLVMAGDFNSGRSHPPFRRATQGMDSAVGRLGAATWPADRWFPAFAEIDHVMTRGLARVDSSHFTVDGTDHRGVWVHLALCR